MWKNKTYRARRYLIAAAFVSLSVVGLLTLGTRNQFLAEGPTQRGLQILPSRHFPPVAQKKDVPTARRDGMSIYGESQDDKNHTTEADEIESKQYHWPGWAFRLPSDPLSVDDLAKLELAIERLIETSQITAAIALLQKALEDVKTAEIRNQLKLQLADLLMLQDQNDMAMSHVEEVLRADPTHLEALQRYQLLMREAKEAAFFLLAEQYLERTPGNRSLRVELATQYEQNGDLDSAIRVLEDGLRSNPIDQALAMSLADLLFRDSRGS